MSICGTPGCDTCRPYTCGAGTSGTRGSHSGLSRSGSSAGSGSPVRGERDRRLKDVFVTLVKVIVVLFEAHVVHVAICRPDRSTPALAHLFTHFFWPPEKVRQNSTLCLRQGCSAVLTGRQCSRAVAPPNAEARRKTICNERAVQPRFLIVSLTLLAER